MKISKSPVTVFARPAMFATFAILLMGTFCLSFSQTTNTRVTGTVKDSTGSVVPGVTVKLIDTITRGETTTTTNDEGYFVFPDVRVGTYVVSAERTGFKRAEVRNVAVHVGTPANLNIDLEAGGVTETVSVTASEAQSLIRSDDSKLNTTIDVRQVQDLPLNGRNPINLAGGAAGVNTNTNVRQSVINGLRGSFSNITWDGISINDNLVRTDSLFGVNTPTVAGVAEFSLTTQNSGPDEGLGIAQVKLTTPRGGSSYHGDVFDYYRNDKFDANSFFNNAAGRKPDGSLVLPKPKLLQHQYGFTVGGPFAVPRFGEGGPSLALKKKLFFYFFYEKTNTTQDFTPLRTVLSAGARQGNFTYLRADNGQAQTVNLLALSGRTIDPRIQTLINLTPASNNNDAGDTRNTQGFRFNTPNGSTFKNLGFRIDYDINSSNRVEAIYSRAVNTLPNDVALNNIGEQFPGLPGGGQQSIRPRLSAAWNSSLTSNITNEVRVGFARSTPSFVNRETFDVGYRLFLGPANPATPFTTEYITNPIQNFLQQGRTPTTYDFMDNVAVVKGSHVIKFGFLGRMVRILNFNDAGIVPQFSVGFNTTTNPMPVANNTGNFPGGISSTEYTNATRLLGVLTGAVNAGQQTFNVADRTSGFSRGVGSIRHLDYNTLAFYGGDTWRVKPNLSLNFGLRWEYIGPITERDGLGLMPRDTSLDVLNDPNAVLDFAGAGTGRPFLAKDLNNFAPNFSVAWDPFKDGKTSLRGGFAISYAIDNNATVLNNAAVGGNAGLQSTFLDTARTGTVTGGGIGTLPTPAFVVPRTLLDQLTLSQTPTLFTTEFNLATPYAAQWNIGIDREIFRDTALSVGYVGNRGIQLTRGLDTNQVVIFQNGFFQDFLRAQSNLAQFGNPACTAAQAAATGCQVLTIFPRLGSAGLLTNATIRTLISQGQVGELAATYVGANRNTFMNTSQPCVETGTGRPCPSFFLPANGNAFVTDYVGSSGWSDYHGLQAEIRKRFSSGWYYQINYTWSKAFTNAEQAQAEFAPYLDNAVGDVLEKKRNNQDVQHALKGNAVYELPFGPGKRFFNGGGLSGKFLGGWQVSTIAQIRTGRPITFISGRGTVNRTARSGNNTPNTTLTLSELQSMTGLFSDPRTGLPLLVDPRMIGPDGRANPEFLTHPGAGTFGNLSLTPVDGPSYWNADAALIKRTRFTESINVELRLEAFNVFNHTNFSVPNSLDINSTSFGKITSTSFGGVPNERIIQLAAKFNF
jgi:Carboxypeptidase regulatory-like domain